MLDQKDNREGLFFLTEVELTHHVTCKNTDWMTLCVRLCEELFKITLFSGQIPN